MSTASQLEEDAANAEAKVNARMAAYEALLRGAAGFFGTQPWITRREFDRYFHQVEVAQNYPGFQGIGLSLRILPSQLADFEAAARREDGKEFHLWPGGTRDEYHAILYLEPLDQRNRVAIGYDMHTDPVRRAAMDQARDTGEPALTGRVTLVQEIDVEKQAGFLVYVPFYASGGRPATEEERRSRLAGYAYAAFRAGDLFHALVEPDTLRPLNVSIYDGVTVAETALLFTNAQELGLNDRLITERRTLHVLGRPWTIVCSAEPHALISPYAVGLFGVIATAGLAFVFRGIERARHRAEQSEAETRAREGELALLVDAVPALVTYLDRDGVLRLTNRRFADWFGVDPQSIVNRHFSELVGAGTFADVDAHLQQAVAGHGVSFERWYKLPAMGARYLHTLYVPHRGPAGDVVGVYALTSDLTAHKRAEEAARFVADCGKLLIASMDFESASRGIVHLAVPRVADVAVLFRADDHQLQADAVAHADAEVEAKLSRFLDRVRLPLSAPNNIGIAARTGNPVVTAELNPDELDRAAADEPQREMLRTLQLRSALHVPVVVRNRIWAVFSFGTSAISGRQFTDEHRQLAEEISTRVRLAVENALLYHEAQQEIEERRRAERVARETEERFRLLVEGVRDYAIMALDAQGNIESWNDGAERILGYAENDVLGHPATELYAPEDRAAGIPENQLKSARESGAASDERWFPRRDGTRFWASSHTAALREDGAVRGYAWILRDLTDRKRMEEELELRVQLRTTELNEAVHELEAFSYSVSHDLRAPLRTIRSFTELALEEAGSRLNEQEQGYLDRVRRASLRLERLIADLLAYTRISKSKVELRPVDLNSLVFDIQHEHPAFQPPLADVTLQGPLIPVIGNEAYLTQCITNLLGNAVKFVPEGRHPVVRIWTERVGAMVRLYVADNGIGIATERLSRAFEMFERLHTTGTYEGTGVGLAIVRRAVQRMKGTVGVTSTLGEGTTFWIELPAVQV